MSPVDPVRFTVWSDVLCPWCYVVAVRLDEVERAAGDALTVEWKSFLLRPQPEDRELDRFRRYTESWRRPAEAEPGAAFRVWSGTTDPPSHSLPPAIAGKVAASYGHASLRRFQLALMRAYFADNLTVSAREVILDVASRAGFDGNDFAARLDADAERHTARIVDDHKDALRRGIAAVPTVVVDDEYVLTGAMSIEQYSRVVARLGG